MQTHTTGATEAPGRSLDNGYSVAQGLTVLGATSAALLMLNVSPAAEVYLRHDAKFSLSEIGAVDFTELAMMALATLPAYWWLERLALARVARWAYAAFFLGNLLCLVPNAGFPVYLLARALVGVAAGSLMILGMTCAARAHATQRLFVVITAMQQASGAIALALLPSLAGQGRGLRGFFLLCCGAGMLGWLSARWVPDSEGSGAEPLVSTDQSGPLSHVFQGGTVTFVLAFNMAVGALWAFIGEYSTRLRMPQESLEEVLVVATVIGLVGTAGAYALGSRYPLQRPIGVALFGLAASAYLMHAADQDFGFIAGCLAFSFCWNFCVPNVLAAVARKDPRGHSMLGVNLAFAMGLAIGPLAAGVLIQAWGLGALFALAAACLSVSAALVPSLA